MEEEEDQKLLQLAGCNGKDISLRKEDNPSGNNCCQDACTRRNEVNTATSINSRKLLLLPHSNYYVCVTVTNCYNLI